MTLTVPIEHIGSLRRQRDTRPPGTETLPRSTSSSVFTPTTRTGFTIGVDVGGTKVAYGLFNGERELTAASRSPPTPPPPPRSSSTALSGPAAHWLRTRG